MLLSAPVCQLLNFSLTPIKHHLNLHELGTHLRYASFSKTQAQGQEVPVYRDTILNRMNHCPQLTSLPKHPTSSFLKCPIKGFRADRHKTDKQRAWYQNFPQVRSSCLSSPWVRLQKDEACCGVRSERWWPEEQCPFLLKHVLLPLHLTGCSSSWVRSKHPERSQIEHAMEWSARPWLLRSPPKHALPC